MHRAAPRNSWRTSISLNSTDSTRGSYLSSGVLWYCGHIPESEFHRRPRARPPAQGSLAGRTSLDRGRQLLRGCRAEPAAAARGRGSRVLAGRPGLRRRRAGPRAPAPRGSRPQPPVPSPGLTRGSPPNWGHCEIPP